MAGMWSEIERSETPIWTSIRLSGTAIANSTSGGAFTRAMAEEWVRLARDIQREEERILGGRMDGIDYSSEWWGISRLDPDLVMDVGL